MVNEIVLAIDPFLCKIEQILLWKHKGKSMAIFTLCHFLFWLFLNYNIRTYCTISVVLLIFHLLDMYRTKKRRDLIKLHQSNKNITEAEEIIQSPKNESHSNLYSSLSSLGKFIIYFKQKISIVYNQLNRLKRRNRFLYFTAMLIFWSMTAIIGTRIQGFYLSYIVFWIIFTVPAVVHFDIPKKILSRALPLLEQLDQSMKYERRSVLDKSDLLVDVKHKTSEENDEAEEDEYLKSFVLGDLSRTNRRVFENLEDSESLYSDHTEYEEDEDEVDEDEDDEEEVTEEVYEVETYVNHGRTSGNNHNKEYQVTKLISKKSSKDPAPVKTSNIQLEVFDMQNDSLLNDEFMPNVNMSALNSSLLHTSNDESFAYNTRSRPAKNIDLGNKVLKNRRVKNRPNILDYYGDSGAASATGNTQRTPQNERDIDDTFDFLDEELDKY